MTIIRPSKAINKIIVLQPGPSGSLVRTVLYQSRNEKKKQTRSSATFGEGGASVFQRSACLLGHPCETSQTLQPEKTGRLDA